MESTRGRDAEISQLGRLASLGELLRQRAEQHPQRQAYLFLADGETEGPSLTYRELDRQARAIAAELQQSLQVGERALLLYPPGLEFITAFYGCLMAGVVAVPAYPPRQRPEPRLEVILEDASPQRILTVTPLLKRLRTLGGDRPLLATDGLSEGLADHWRRPDLGRGDIAFLQYTSGSTSAPKGVKVGHGNLLHNQEAIRRACGHSERLVMVSWLPPYHDMGLIGTILQPVYTGGRSVLMAPVAFLRRPRRWLEAVSRFRATTSGAPNFAYELCVSTVEPHGRHDLDLSSWQVAFNGAEPVRPQTLERFAATFAPCGFRREAFFPCYGLAEATLMVTGADPTASPTAMTIDALALEEEGTVRPPASEERQRQLVGCGRPVFGQGLLIVDPQTGQRCPPDRIGEVWVTGPSVAHGYWNRPQESAETFGARLADGGEDEDGFLRTGDLGFIADGELFITGRLKDLIILRGRNFYPQDVELSAERSHPELRPAAAVAFSVDDGGEEALVVLAEVRRTAVVSGPHEEILAAMRRAIVDEHQVQPRVLGLLRPHALLRTTSGKIQRRACRKGFLAGDFRLVARQSEAPAAAGVVAAAAPVAEGVPADEECSPATSSARRERLIAWLRDYAEHRIHSLLIDRRRSIPPHVVLDFGNQGLFGLQVPESFGGLGLRTGDMLRVMEQVAAIDPSLATFLGVHNSLGVRPIQRFAAAAVRDELLPVLAAGRELAAFAMTEPGAGSNVRAVASRAVPDGDGWRLYGTKIWSGNAGSAGAINVFARVSGGGPGAMAGFVVRPGRPGLTIGPEALTMGLRGLTQNRIDLDGVPVARGDLLGGRPDAGLAVAQDTMRFTRMGICSMSLGAMKRCTQLMLRYAGRRRISTGRLLDNPVTLLRLGQHTAAIAALEAMLYGIAERLDCGQEVPEELYDACKITAPELLWSAVDDLVQTLGGRGYIETNEAPHIFRDARLFRIFEGPTETLLMHLGARWLHRAEVLARFLERDLGAPAIARALGAAAAAVHDHVTAASPYTRLPGSASLRWAQVSIGELASRALLWAFVDEAARRQPSADLERALAWARWRFESAATAMCDAGLADAVLRPGDEIEEVVDRYRDAIGDVEQHAAGEEVERDVLLRRSGTAAREVRPSAGAAETRPAAPAPTTAAGRRSAREIEDWLVSWIATKMDLDAAAIDPRRPFVDYGLDSVSGVLLAGDLGDWLGETLDATLIWDEPTIAEAARRLTGAPVPVPPAGEGKPPSVLAGGHGLDDLLSSLESLSEEEAAAAAGQPSPEETV